MDSYIAGTTLHERAVSAFPLSIGTSLAFESAFPGRQKPYDPDRKIPEPFDPMQYQTCWINLTTLFRNLVSAIDKDAFLKAFPGQLANTLMEEVLIIESLFENEGRGVCQPVYYYSTYEDLKKKQVPGLAFREPSTDNMRQYEAKLLDTIKYIEKQTDSIIRFKDAIMPKQREKAFVLTHQPYDLVNFAQFEQLDLLESNTGVLKPRARWNSKYAAMSGESFVHLPFFRKILLVMGDRVLIKPFPPKVRKEILECSIKRNWTPMTTLEKCLFDLDLDIRDPYTMASIKAL